MPARSPVIASLAVVTQLGALGRRVMARNGRFRQAFWMDEFLIEGFEVVNQTFFAESSERIFLASLAHARSE
jgi:hypothetical protein